MTLQASLVVSHSLFHSAVTSLRRYLRRCKSVLVNNGIKRKKNLIKIPSNNTAYAENEDIYTSRPTADTVKNQLGEAALACDRKKDESPTST